MDFKQEAEKIFPKAVEIRRHLHMYPELSERENETRKYICSILDGSGISYRNSQTTNAVVARLGKENGRSIGIRADMDALPVEEKTGLDYSSKNKGVMHACGHDMHTAILLSTAMVLKEHEKEIPGNVKFFFQPAEETVGGAERMIKEGCLEDPETKVVIGLHVDPAYEAGTIVLKYGPMNAASRGFTVKVHGKSCHGARPEEGIDPIVASAQVILSLQTISSRFTASTTPVIVTVGKIHGGTAGNVIPSLVELKGTIRSLSLEGIERVKKHVERISTNTAAALGGYAEVNWEDDGYPPLINDDHVTSVLEKTARRLFGGEKLEFMKKSSMGADDFAFFTEAVKGSYFNLGTALRGEPLVPLHSERYAPCEDAMRSGVAMFSASVFSLFAEDSLF